MRFSRADSPERYRAAEVSRLERAGVEGDFRGYNFEWRREKFENRIRNRVATLDIGR